MWSNFSFLQQEFEPMFAMANKAEQHAYNDPIYCAFLCRKSLEQFIKWMYDNDEDLTIPADTTLNSLIFEQSFKNAIPQSLFRNINFIRITGNVAAHGSKKVEVNESLASVKFLFDFSLWVVRIYSRTLTPVVQFDENLLPKGDLIERTRKEAEQLAKQYEDTRQQLLRANEELLSKENFVKELEQRLAEVHAIKEQNREQVVLVSSVSEAETRLLYVDVLLKEAGWDISLPNATEFIINNCIVDGEIAKADYVLWGDDGKPLAVVEAKKTKLDAHKGQRQAEVYASGLEKIYAQRPILFYTNGFETNIWDDTFYPPREVQGFYTKDELQLLINRRIIRKPLSQQQINREIIDRYYQEEAIKRVAETLEKKARGALLVMATGSGKTRTAAALTDLLTKANWAKRILFLADRNALVTQAKNAFNKHLPQLTAIDLTKEDEDTASRIVFSTYQTMMNCVDNSKVDGLRFYGVGHFDVVIIDEAHRSIYERYRAIFKYFDAIYIGLTATPKADADKDTYEAFGLEPHNPTYAYELDRAVNDGYLVPPRAIKVPLKFPREGIKYKDLSAEDKERYERDFLETHGIVPDEVSNSAINDWLFNVDTVNKVLELLMEKGLKIEGGDKLGKTIIFAKNHNHAKFIEECFNNLYPDCKGKMLRVIDNQVYNAQDMIYQFSNPENKEFLIAVSVDMLDTGIDIPEILNLVIFKPVRSKSKFWQMIGRGTRLRPGIFGPRDDKKFFYVFDVCGNIEFFSSQIPETEPRLRGTLSEQIFKAKLRVAFILQEYRNLNLYQAFQQQLINELHQTVSSFNADDFRVRMELRYVEKYKNRDEWNELSNYNVIEIENHLAHLYSDDSNEPAKRFDLMMLQYILQDVERGKKTNCHKQQIQLTTRGLLKKLSIPVVKAQENLINAVLEDTFWINADIPTLDETRLALRNLIQYIEFEKQKILYTNIEDTLADVEEVNLLNQYQELGAYQKRVEKFIRENRNHITIHRIINNQPITKQEVEELERLLFSIDKNGNKELLEKAIDGKPLGKFIRSILGLDVNAAKEVFGNFLSNANLNPTQIHFINIIIDYLSVNGTIDKQLLFERPFTEINDQGLTGVFSMEQAGTIVKIIDTINKNATEAITG